MRRATRWMCRLLLSGGTLASVGGCGGGGGDSGSVTVTTTGGIASVSGSLRLASLQQPVGVEVEPNDSLGQPHDVGAVLIGQRIALLGAVDAANDPLDGYRMRSLLRARVNGTLTFDAAAPNDLAVLLYEPASLQPVAVFDVPSGTSTLSFTARGAFDVVVTALAGACPYELDLDFTELPAGQSEHEPNGAPSQAEFVGTSLPGDTLLLLGTATSTADAVDRWLVSWPLASEVTLQLQFPSFARFDLELADATGDVLSPAPLAVFAGASPSPLRATLPVGAGTLLAVTVRAVSGGGPWSLTLTARPPGAAAPKPGTGAGRAPASLALEGARVRGLLAPYGRVDGPLVAGDVLVGVTEGSSAAATLSGAGGGLVTSTLEGASRARVPIAEGLSAADARRATLAASLRLFGCPGVRYAEPNWIAQLAAVPNDFLYPGQRWHFEQLHLPQAWDVTTGSDDVLVAVLDTGVMPHPDLLPRLVPGYDMVFHTAAWPSGDGDGYDSDPSDATPQWQYHGTHVAGIVAASTNDGTGTASVTWRTRVMPIRVFGSYGATIADVSDAIRYAAGLPNASGTTPAKRANVINMSLGFVGYYPISLGDACQAAYDAGVLLVAAAGNSGQGRTSVVMMPASFPSVVAVGATDIQGQRVAYSSWGGSGPEVMAPGGDTSTDINQDGLPDGVLSLRWNDSTSPGVPMYDVGQGTSFAAPHVCGVAALLLAVRPDLTPPQLREVLKSTARDLETPGVDVLTGWGLVDAFQALLQATGAAAYPARLWLDEHHLSFGATLTELSVGISNLGLAALTVDAPQVTTVGNLPWLTAELAGPATPLQDAAMLRLHANRAGLGSGVYTGRVLLTSSGGTDALVVTLVVLPSQVALPRLPIQVQAVDLVTGAVVRSIDVDGNADLHWALPNLPAGSYRLRAVTDFDHDGVFDEPGEYVGAFPDVDLPEAIVVQAGDVRAELSIVVVPRLGQ